RKPSWRAIADARHFDRLVGTRKLSKCTRILELDLLGVIRRCAQTYRDIVRDLIARDRNDRSVTDRAAGEHRDIGRTAADVYEAHAELLLVLGQHRVTRSELLEHDVLDRQPAALHALDDVLSSAFCARHDVHLGLEPDTRHANRLANAFLTVNHELLRKNVQDLLV